ncbi:MAG: aldolase/citrate lyase family protein [Silicimonas sp.]|nr:aldolase/citrate lyase family protein [Silicimonas sp.]
MITTLHDIWNRGGAVLNGWCSIGNPFSAEIMAAQGFDAITIDGQHGALDYSDALPMFQSMRASGKPILARAPWREPGVIMKYLDAGAMGIICPMINTAEEAAEFVSFMRYPPLGQRSSGPTRAAFAHPGYNPGEANDTIVALAMIETAQGVENLEEIAATPGLDGLYVGPSDLTLGVSNGALPPGMDRQEPEMIEVIQRIARVARDNNLHAALHCGSPEYAARAIGWGFDMVTVQSDVNFIANGARAMVRTFRDLSATEGESGQAADY